MAVVLPPKLTYPLVCTVSTLYRKSMALPSDGVCDYLFYDSLYKDNMNIFTEPLSNDLYDFLKRAGQHKTTEFGLSFDYENQLFQSDYNTSAFQALVADVANEGVLHLGILNMLNDTTDNATMDQALHILLKFEEYMAPTRTAARYRITALGLSVDVPKVFTWYRERFQKIYLPHLIVAVSHFSYRDADRPDCEIMPPSILRHPNHVTLHYGHTLLLSVSHVTSLARKHLQTSGTVSVTMKGRWYQPKYSDASYADLIGTSAYYEDCAAFYGDQDIAPATVCQTSTDPIKKNYQYDKVAQAGISFDKELGRTLTLETERSLRVKLCGLKKVQLRTTFSIAVYDIDFDAPGPACAQLNITGPYRRLQLIHNIRDFFRDLFRKSGDESQCLKVTI
ncbi:hypothetical protein HPB49_010390 [Dermacentor silvarum]|uniref:Uncharacterized protein n=1 Tax=Dermacentor silvarum TaxID=543639 RepID=A0ACB8DIL4_DERSI|nr:hypothetical protein HPB49_010390 [Dermacentor silvarum]